MPSTPVSISNDLTLTVSMVPLVTVHDALGIPPAVLPPFMPHLELPVTVMWPPGFGLLQNKLTTTVLHKMMPLALDGHDCGYMIIHVPIPPAPVNVKLVLHIMFSSRKMAFSASKVKANGTAVACTSIWFPIPMLCCANPITMPIGTAPFNLLNTVKAGMTWADVIFGALSIAVTMAIDFLTWDRAAPISLPSATDWIWKATLGDSPGVWALKTGAGLAVNAARLLAGEDGSLSVAVGPGGYWGAGAGLSVRSLAASRVISTPGTRTARPRPPPRAPRRAGCRSGWVVSAPSRRRAAARPATRAARSPRPPSRRPRRSSAASLSSAARASSHRRRRLPRGARPRRRAAARRGGPPSGRRGGKPCDARACQRAL